MRPGYDRMTLIVRSSDETIFKFGRFNSADHGRQQSSRDRVVKNQLIRICLGLYI